MDLQERLEASGTDRWSVPRGALISLAAATLGGLVWYTGKITFGQSELLGGYVAALAVLVGVGAGYGALLGSGRNRGFAMQGIALAMTLGLLTVFQDLVMQVHVTRLENALAAEGLRFATEPTFADRFAEGFFGTNFVDLAKVAQEGTGATAVPGLIFWVIAIVYAIALPRAYKHE